MTKIVCEVIKKINENPGFARALSFIYFQKWLDIVQASADEWPISANDDSECILLYIYSRKSIIWSGNSSDSVPEVIGNIGQYRETKRPISGKRHFLYWKYMESRGWPSMVIVGRPMNSNDPQLCPFDKFLIWFCVCVLTRLFCDLARLSCVLARLSYVQARLSCVLARLSYVQAGLFCVHSRHQ